MEIFHMQVVHRHLSKICRFIFYFWYETFSLSQIFPQNDAEVCVCVRCEQKLHEINDFYHMVLRCHTLLLDQSMSIVENDFLQELREDEIQNALDLLGSGCELSEFETFSASPAPPPIKSYMDRRESIDENNNNAVSEVVLKSSGKRMIKQFKNFMKEKYVCDICQSAVNLKDALKQHMLMKHLSSPIPCEKCHKLLNPSSLYLHEKLQHSQTVDIVTCPVCKAQLKHERALHEHLKKIHKFPKTKPSIKTFHRICPTCGKIYTNKNSFYDHLRIKHPKFSPESLRVACDLCGKSFKRQHLLLKHRKTHERLKESCPICFRAFHDPERLRFHMNEHENKQELRCKFCSKVYTNKFSLKNHYQSHHAGNVSVSKEAECVLCHRLMSSEHALKGHLRRVHKMFASKTGQDIELDKPKIVPILRQYEEVFL